MKKLVYTPAGSDSATLAIAASRAHGIGILNAELFGSADSICEQLIMLSKYVDGSFGIKLDSADAHIIDAVKSHLISKLHWLVVDAEIISACADTVSSLRDKGVNVLAEVSSPGWPGGKIPEDLDGFVLKGNEAGGFVGEYSSFILLQKWLSQTKLPLYVRGGVTPHVAAACDALGASGVVLDSQVLLLDESPFSNDLSPLLKNLSGNETVSAGDSEQGQYFRLLVRPGLKKAQEFCDKAERVQGDRLRSLIDTTISWQKNEIDILPLGQDVCFAGPWKKRFGSLSRLFTCIDDAVNEGLSQALLDLPISKNAPLARYLGTEFPIVQGPMARVSDCSEFAVAVSQGGGLPMLALALQKGRALEQLLRETKNAVGEHPWGVGVLGFAPQTLLDEQLQYLQKYTPDYVIIAGGRPDQAVKFQQANVPSFLHVPSSNLIPLFLQQGARGFIFEGRECGGHIGPLSSFVLWGTMVESLLEELESGNIQGEEVKVLFAGGVHNALSSAFVQVLAAPLTRLGVQVGIIMGSAYLFTKEIVDCGAILPTFQKTALACTQTVNLESGPGHASRCAYTPFAHEFFQKKRDIINGNLPAHEKREVLDDLIMGRLRIASKGCSRSAVDGELQRLNENQQLDEGMFMLGQLATLRKEVVDIRMLHEEVTTEATKLLQKKAKKVSVQKANSVSPADIAIIGIATFLPGADTFHDYWNNILQKKGSIREVPSHRWDWQLYYSKNRQARDKVYSKWGGFLNDLPFDPTQFGMPPNSVKSVDPMQLMALHVANMALADSGYLDKSFDRENASVVIGASGGTGDVGLQYGLRSELPRFTGSDIPSDIADRLPEWTEDTFAGILMNVIAGRISNRLNLGGVNFSTDAACASSLAAIYQGVNELEAKRSNFVLAGGVDTVQGPFGFMCFSKTQALSPSGQCNTFDAGADGIVISEGIGMVVLKRLEDAEKDGDRIYAVIKGIGGGSDGKAKGLSAPSPSGQLRAMKRAYVQAGFGPETVELFEAHGTGTVAGDTAELESTTKLLVQAGGKAHQAAVGSVKTLIGHTKASAGVAGMIKAVLALHHRILPPHHGVERPNKVLLDDNCPLYLVKEPRPWLKTNGSHRRAAVSAFGFGGSNFHVVLEEYTREYRPWLRMANTPRWPAELFVFCAKDRKDLEGKLAKTREEILENAPEEFLGTAHNLANQWRRDNEVLAIVASDANDLKNKLDRTLDYLTNGEKRIPPHTYHNKAPLKGKIAVLFPGQGAQYLEMLRELACHFPLCAETIARTDDLLADKFQNRYGDGVCLSDFIYPRGVYDEQQRELSSQALTNTDVVQPALGAVEAGVWMLMQCFNLKPDMIAGHSYGEFVALFAGGYMGFETLVSLSEARGRAIVDTAAKKGQELGAMAAIMAGRDEVTQVISKLDNVILANCNGPKQCIISGSESGVSEAIDMFAKAGVRTKKLPVAAAFHSPFVEPAQRELAEVIAKSEWRVGNLPVYSNVTAKPHSKDIEIVKQQMANHLISPVEFMDEIEEMYRDGARIFIELGPKAGLSRMVSDILDSRPHETIAIEGECNGIKGLLCSLGKLVTLGVDIDLMKIFEGRVSQGDQSAKGKKADAVSSSTWMINGSGVRRASDPIKQVGVIKGKGDSTASLVANKSVLSTSVNNLEKKTYSHMTTDKVRKEAPKMVKQRSGPTVESSTVMDKYFDTMQTFLETQENVMSFYLGRRDMQRRGMHTTQQSLTRPLLLDNDDDNVKMWGQIGSQSVAGAQDTGPEVTTPKPASPNNDRRIEQPLEKNKAPEEAKKQGGKEEKQEDIIGQPQAMTNLLLSVVEEKTGYPKDMIGLEQNLEADLGIDSIKRVEIAGAVLMTLPEEYNQLLGEDERTKLNTQETLQGMLDLLGNLHTGGEAASPFAKAGAEKITPDQSYPFRHVVVAQEEAIASGIQGSMIEGHFLLTEDKIGVSEAVSGALTQRGGSVTFITRETLVDEGKLNDWCSSFKLNGSPLAGIIHLAPLGTDQLRLDSTVPEWREQIQLNEKSLFILLRHFCKKMTNDAHVVSTSRLGGYYNRNNVENSEGLFLQGGTVGLLKSLSEEHPELRIRAIDLDLNQPANLLSQIIINEMNYAGGRQEVGYPEGRRTVFSTVESSIDLKKPTPIRDAVILATGGLKGITAETLRSLALPGNTLVILGRSSMPEIESSDLRSFETAKELQEYFIDKVRSGNLSMTPAEIKKRVSSILSSREMVRNVNDFTQSGALVEYHAIDVTDEGEISKLLEQTYKKHGKIDGVVHGAGIIEDKLLADKTDASWSRVIETKVIGLLLLQKYLVPESLRFFVVFSSVAGRYGNSGQTDYATANELMSRLCCQLKNQWPESVNIRSFCWGPWGKTKFSDGMVTAETEAKFAEKGVFLVEPAEGCATFNYELSSGKASPVEIICGKGPWEEYEATREHVEVKNQTAQPGKLGPLLYNMNLQIEAKGKQVVSICLDESHSYLQDHRIDGRPVMPAAVALETMAEVTSFLYPGWIVSEVSDVRLLKGIDLETKTKEIRISVSPPTYGSSEGFDVSAAILSTQGNSFRTHYRAVLRLRQQLSCNSELRPLEHSEKQLSVSKAYKELLFHGPKFQVIEEVKGLSPNGAAAFVSHSNPNQWILDNNTCQNQWLFDPALIDAAAQMAILWSRTFKNETSLPARIDSVVRYVETLPERVHMSFEILEVDDPHVIRADVNFLNSDQEAVYTISGLECISSAALNRLGGTASQI